MERTPNYYQNKKVEELVKKFNITTDKASTIVSYCSNICGGLTLHWFVDAACAFVKSFEGKIPEYNFTTLELLQMFTRSRINKIHDWLLISDLSPAGFRGIIELTISLFRDLSIEEEKANVIKKKISDAFFLTGLFESGEVADATATEYLKKVSEMREVEGFDPYVTVKEYLLV